MFDHVKFGVTDYAASKAFYIEALTPLGVSIVSEGAPSYGIEMSNGQSEASLCLYQTEDKPVPFTLPSRRRRESRLTISIAPH